jgi:5-methylcytosine-specific restriction endonuclease McrA
MNTLICTLCREEKLLEEFHGGHKKNGKASRCKSCIKKYYQKNKEKIKKQHQIYLELNKEKIKERRISYYKKNREKVLQQKRKYKNNHLEIVKISQKKFQSSPEGIYVAIKHRMKNKNIYLNFNKQDFVNWYNIQPKECIYCKRPESEAIQDKKGKYKRLTIDRKDNNKGYELNNIALCCYRCNNIKGDWLSYEEMLIIGIQINNLIKQRKDLICSKK